MKMNSFKKNYLGQALVEMVLAIPVLFLFIAGITQFAVLFLCYVQFEHACGEAARQYSAHIVEKDSLGPAIRKNLGYLGRYFDLASLSVKIQEPGNTAAEALDKVRKTIFLIPFAIKYDGSEWAIGINARPPFCFGPLFPRGIPFHTVLQVYRYPQ